VPTYGTANNLITLNSPTSSLSNSTPSLNRPVLSRLQLKTEKARRRQREFVEQAWPVLEPSATFVAGLHVDAICLHLQAVTEGRIGDLIINVPPGHAKSLLTCVFWPAWVWINHPEVRFLFSSHRMDLATRDSVKWRTLIESDWYQSRWGDRFQLRDDQNQKQRFENSRTGYRVVTPVGVGTVERADIVVVDDPTSVDQAESDTERKAANEWWTGTMTTRLNDLRTGHRVVIQQRLHEDDLTGHLLEKGGYELLMLPEEFEPERACSTSIGWRDPRTEPGQLLWPERIGNRELDVIKRNLGSYRYAGQYQQRPSPATGAVYQRWWWRYWKPPGMNLPPVSVRLADGSWQQIEPVERPDEFDQQWQSWDMAFKDLDTSDYVVGQVWAAKGADRFLLDQTRERMSFPQTLDAVKNLTVKWPHAGCKLVEDKANGSAVIATLRHDVAGMIPVNPDGGKAARAQAVSPQVEAGNVYFPHPAIAPWVEAFIDECASFPAGRHDDQVDAMTQALGRQLGAAIYTAAESEILVEPFAIPQHWRRGCAMDVSGGTTAVIWAAWDRDNDVIYLYDEYNCGDADPSVHACAIRERGKWMTVMMNPSPGRSEADTWELIKMYQQLGIEVELGRDTPESGIYAARERMSSSRLKVFSNLSRYREQRRLFRWDEKGQVVKQNDSLLNCCHCLIVSGLDHMRTAPRRTPPEPLSMRVDMGGVGWMR
jgi:predicted phage terminase large subunit-like protein